MQLLPCCCLAAALASSASAQATDSCPNPTFTPQLHPTGYLPAEVAVIDLDGDAVPDVAVCDMQPPFAFKQNNHVTVTLNGGSATYTQPLQYGVGVNPLSLAAGDLDGDGAADLVTADNGWYDFGAQGWKDGGISTLLNNGDGSFRSGVQLLFGPGHDAPSAVEVGDLDGDLDLDLVVMVKGSAYLSGEAAVLLNDGHGGFGAPIFWPAGYTARTMKLGDMNGDGALDLVTLVSQSTSAPQVFVLLGLGNGAFAPSGTGAVVSNYPKDLALADVDGDHDLDALVVREYGVTLLRNNGSGVLGSATTCATAFGPSSVAAGDLDGDGDVDMVTLDTLIDSVEIKLNDGSGIFASGPLYHPGTDPIDAAIADMDQDGDADIVAANATSVNLTTLLNNCATPSLAANSVELDLSAGGTQLLQLAAGSAHANELYLVLGSASGTLPGSLVGSILVPLNSDAYTLAVAQFANVPPFLSTFGVLDAAGAASAAIVLPPGSSASLAGLTLQHAFVSFSTSVDFASKAVALKLVP